MSQTNHRIETLRISNQDLRIESSGPLTNETFWIVFPRITKTSWSIAHYFQRAFALWWHAELHFWKEKKLNIKLFLLFQSFSPIYISSNMWTSLLFPYIAVCEDQFFHCAWSTDMCSSNPDFARNYCPASCEFCRAAPLDDVNDNTVELN